MVLLSELENGFCELKKETEHRASHLRAQLKLCIKLNSADEEWLDGPANLTDETILLNKLRNAPNFGEVIRTLNVAEESTIVPLEKAGSRKIAETGKIQENKRKGTFYHRSHVH